MVFVPGRFKIAYIISEELQKIFISQTLDSAIFQGRFWRLDFLQLQIMPRVSVVLHG